MEIKLALFLPRDAASVPVTRQMLDNCLDTLGVAPGTRDDIALALSEACGNVIRHAGPVERRRPVAAALRRGRRGPGVRDRDRPGRLPVTERTGLLTAG